MNLPVQVYYVVLIFQYVNSHHPTSIELYNYIRANLDNNNNKSNIKNTNVVDFGQDVKLQITMNYWRLPISPNFNDSHRSDIV